MAVKISSLSSGSLKGTGSSGSAARTDETAAGHSLQKTIPGSDDSVNLTHSASELLALENRINQMPVVNAQQVEEVQRKLATGSFRIDPDSAASKFLMMELALS